MDGQTDGQTEVGEAGGRVPGRGTDGPNDTGPAATERAGWLAVRPDRRVQLLASALICRVDAGCCCCCCCRCRPVDRPSDVRARPVSSSSLMHWTRASLPQYFATPRVLSDPMR